MPSGNYGNNFHSPRVDVHSFAMIPRAEIPRSTFRQQHQHKTTFNAANLIPIYVNEVLPGDTFNLSMTAFTRLSTPLFPIMDNMSLESFWFFVPTRILWSHWVNMHGEQPSTPSDSINYSVPQCVSPASGYSQGTIFDYMGIPCSGQIAGGNTISHSALPLRAYNMIWSQWFRDQNLDNAVGTGATNTVGDIGDGPDPYTNYSLQLVRKRHDYFTSCLPWTQKATSPVSFPLTGNATVKTNAAALLTGAQSAIAWSKSGGGAPTTNGRVIALDNTGSPPSGTMWGATYTTGNPGLSTIEDRLYPANLYADLSTVTAVTINAMRLAIQTQRLLERDARGGTRYQELLMSHFGVHPLDSRVQRPEYLGGGISPINITPVPQTSATGLTGGSTAFGSLSAVGTAVARHGFRSSFAEHGYVLGLICVRIDQTYQQGLERFWSRLTRYDFYYPVFHNLGEQAILNKEIYADGSANDALTFGYNERWAEYRYKPSLVTSAFRSTFGTPLDAWHLSQKYTSLPALNSNFIKEQVNATLDRVLAAGSTARTNSEQFLGDFFFDVKCARPLGMYSVPGLMDHF